MSILWFAIGVLVGIGLMIVAITLVAYGMTEGEKKAKANLHAGEKDKEVK